MTRAISLALAAAIATTSGGFAQEGTSTPAPVPSMLAATTPLPVQRTITDTDGRKLEGTIVSKDATNIKFRRTSDGKEFNLPINKLTAGDQAFIAGLAALASKKLRALLVRTSDAEIITALQTHGFEIVTSRELLPNATRKPSGHVDLSPLTATQITDIDLIWAVSFSNDPEEIRVSLKDFKGVVVYATSTPGITRKKVLGDAPPEKGFVSRNYVKANDNFVFYSKVDIATDGATRKTYPENVTKAAEKAVELIREYHR